MEKEDRQYQLDAIEKGSRILNEYGLVVLNMECRTGKTFTGLDIAVKCGYKSILIISPKGAHLGVNEDLDKGEYRNKFDFVMVINLESLHKLANNYDCVIYDEYHLNGYTGKPLLKNKRFAKYAHLPRIGMTATLFPEKHTTAYALFDKEFQEYSNFYKWFADFGIPEKIRVKGHLQETYKKAKNQKIFDRISKYYISATQEEAGFKVFAEEKIHILKCPKVERAIKLLQEDKVVRYGKGEDDVYVADNMPKEFSAVCQMQNGTLKFNDDNFGIISEYKCEYIDKNFKGSKIAIYYKFKAERELLKNYLVRKGWTFCETVQDFEHGDDKAFFLGQFRSKREGVKLDFCNQMVFFGMPHSNLDYLQSKERMLTRNKEDRSIVHFVITKFEKSIYNVVKNTKGKFNSESYKQWAKNQKSKVGLLNTLIALVVSLSKLSL